PGPRWTRRWVSPRRRTGSSGRVAPTGRRGCRAPRGRTTPGGGGCSGCRRASAVFRRSADRRLTEGIEKALLIFNLHPLNPLLVEAAESLALDGVGRAPLAFFSLAHAALPPSAP